MKNLDPILMICFARSGGTLLSRILKTNTDNIILSEIGTKLGISSQNDVLSSSLAIKDQLSNWYKISVNGNNTSEIIKNLNDFCIKNNRRLIIRDWVYNDYVPNKYNHFKPSNLLTSYYNYKKILSNLNIFALVRNPIDILLSMDEDINHFSNFYLEYAKDLIRNNIRIFRYENLASNTADTIIHINKFTGNAINHKSSLWNTISQITGDVQSGFTSRGNRSKNIIKFKRKWISSSKRVLINNNQKLKYLSTAFGYSFLYEDEEFQTFLDFISEKLINKFYSFYS